MKKFFKVFLIFILCFSLIFVQSAFALISISQEIQLGKEIFKELSRQVEFVKDVELNAYVNDIGRILVKKGIGVPPYPFHFYVIKDDTFNAFSIPGGFIFINSGVFEHINSEDELAGIMAHEIAHDLCRHVVRQIENAQKFQLLTIAAIIAAILSGNPKVVNAVGATSIAMAQTKMLAYSREDEEEADRVGLQVLEKAGYNPWGMVEIMQRLSRESDFAIEVTYKYLLTHPLPQERLNYLSILASEYTKNKKPADLVCPDKTYFKRLKIRATVISKDPESLVLIYKQELFEKKDPWIRYALALTLEKERFFKEAISYMKEALKALPKRDFFKIDLAELYFKAGDYHKALNVLNEITLPKSPKYKYQDIIKLKYFYLKAKILCEIGKFVQAFNLLNNLSNNSVIQNIPEFFFYFGKVASALNKKGIAHYCFGRYYELLGNYSAANYHYRQALLFLNKTDKMYFKLLERLRQIRGFNRKKRNKQASGGMNE
ncbi:MAG: M48 family metalloprotease [Thermodesulfobacteria bacterium]|nr:M48 family metalloprotease [Thermodesulfobacteriota bacterium]